jgi:hypothetical protein
MINLPVELKRLTDSWSLLICGYYSFRKNNRLSDFYSLVNFRPHPGDNY